MTKKFVPGQLGLFAPDTTWTTPTELPDLRSRSAIAFDTEGRDEGIASGRGPGWALGPLGRVIGVSWAAEGSVGYAPIAHPDTENFPAENVWRWLRDHHVSDTSCVFHNSPYDTGWLGCYGVPSPTNLQDTLAAAVLLDETERSYSLDACAARAGVPGKDTALLADAVEAYGGDRRRPQSDLWRLPARYVGPYAEADAAATLGLWRQYEPALRATGVWDAYRTEMELVPMVVAMRRRGIRLDTDGAIRTRAEFLVQRDLQLSVIKEVCGLRREPTMEDLNSPRWLEQLFASEHIPFPRTTGGSTGRTQGSFSKKWMERHEHPLPRAVTQARKFHDAANKFIDNFLLGFSSRGRIHSEVHQFLSEDGGTRSHRFSYSEPPLQQMTSPDKDPRDANKQLIEDLAVGTKLRRLLLPEEGTRWVANDYCYDSETEVLTRDGWKFLEDLSGNEHVAQYDHGEVTFVKPTSIYRGEAARRTMVHVRSPRQIDFRVTENHRCLIVPDRHPEIEEVHRAGDLSLGVTRAHSLPQAGWLVGGHTENASLLRLVVALQADAADRGTSWRFFLKKNRKKHRLVTLLTNLGWSYHHYWCGDKEAFVISDCQEIRYYLGQDKTFDLSHLLELDEASRNIFVEETFFWDGSGNNYCSTNVRCVEVVQILAVLSGRRANIIRGTTPYGNKPIHSVSVSRRQTTNLTLKLKITKEETCEPVFCVTVPSGFILVRRRGRVAVSGNSQQEPRITVHFAAMCKIAGSELALRAYQENPRTDYHQMVADLTGMARPRAKILNLALTYGKGLVATAEELGVSEEEARAIMNTYFERLPYIKPLEETCKRLAGRRGYIRLIDGARMHYTDWDAGWLDREVMMAARAAFKRLEPCKIDEARERQADPEHPWHGRRLRRADTRKSLNNLVQGSAARQTKIAMLHMWREGILPLIQMHDEVGASVESEAQASRIAQIMTEAVPLAVPVVVDTEIGTCWGNAKMTWAECVARYGEPT